MALSNRIGSARIFYADEMTENQGMGSIVNTDNDVVSHQCNVQTTTLDAFVDQSRLPQIDFMKVDIQGAEIFLMEGGEKVFSTISPDFVMEISPLDLRCISKTSKDLIQIISGYGYKMYELGLKGKILHEIDPVTVKPDYTAGNIYCTKKSSLYLP